MKLFTYYAWHSFINQIRKILKTWVLIFLLVCMVIGGVIGFGAAKLEDLSEETAGETVTEETGEPDLPEIPSPLEAVGLAKSDVLELAAGALILGILIYQVLSADTNGSKIFLPADVNLLFSSPMSPQSVLLFRLLTKLGMFIFLGFYMLLQLPNLVLNMGMSVPGAVALIVAWVLTIIAGCLLQVLLYCVSSTHNGTKKYLRRSVYALLGVILLSYGLFWSRSGRTPLEAAVAFFNAPVSRFVPLWGWIKGFFLFVNEGNYPLALVCLVLTLALDGVLFWAITRVKADFYEDAMAKSEETAALLEAARAEKGNAVTKRKKDRSDKLQRDGMHYGRGASVFFYKSLYNRFRFAHAHFFTKTMETYLAAGVGVALLCRFVIKTDSVLPAILTLAAISFFRSLGNPLEQDTKMDFFLLIPESNWSKLFYSLLGGSANCLLDLIPGLLAAALIQGGSIPRALLWAPFIVSLDFYATTVGAFINLSVPAHAGATIKQIVQIMFIYFGLLPDVAILAVGIVMDHMLTAVLIAVGVNLALGLLFFSLTPLFLEPGSKSAAPRRTASAEETRLARKDFSRLGWGLTTILAGGTLLQILAGALAPEAWAEYGWTMWVVTFAPLYLIAVPLGCLIMKKVPSRRGESAPWGVGRYLAVLPICFFMMFGGNLVGQAVNALLQSLLRVSDGNPVAAFAMTGSLGWKILIMVIVAPCVEEFVFRRMLIDRMRPYGEKLAVVTSAVAFGLFHGNFSQLFYAFTLGLVLGYVYLKTSRLRYSVSLHMLINCLGSVLAPALLEWADLGAAAAVPDLSALTEGLVTPGRVAFGAYLIVYFLLAVVGLVLLCIRARRVRFAPAERELAPGTRFKVVWLNSGMIAFFLSCAAMIVFSLLAGA